MFSGSSFIPPVYSFISYRFLVMDGFSSVVMGFLCLFTVGFSFIVTKGSRIVALL